MKWLTAILVLLLVGLAAFPAAFGGGPIGWFAGSAAGSTAIDYLPRALGDRGRPWHHHGPDRMLDDARRWTRGI